MRISMESSRLRQRLSVTALAVIACLMVLRMATAHAVPAHGIAMHGQLQYKKDFSSFAYVNPSAPKGGNVTFAAVGTFDSTNPMIVKGIAAMGLRAHVFESLLARNLDEPFSLYGLLAESVEVPDDRSWVEFTLRQNARFSDGSPVTVEDVVFSLEVLRDHGRPNYQSYYSKVARTDVRGPRTVRFVFEAGTDRELPLILGLMAVLPKHHYDKQTFEATTLAAPLGSGPYIVERIQPGERIVYRRDPNYWGGSLAVNAGRHNFDTVRYDYYRDQNSAFEAFKKGLCDVRLENDPTRWARGYDFPAVGDGRIVREKIPTKLPSGMNAFVFNTRRPVFSDIRVRKALLGLFDFSWVNKNLYFGLYARTQSYFDNSELSSHGRPADRHERQLLRPYIAGIDPDILEGRHQLPDGDGTGRNRKNLRKALGLLKQAGYALRDGRLTNMATGKPFAFELLVIDRDQERLALNFAGRLKSAGIEARVRQIDSTQYQNRKQNYDFDMIPNFWFASLSPGNEQSFYWGTYGRETPGTRNYMGTENPAIDDVISALLKARDRSEFVSTVRALDRILLSEIYVIPLFFPPSRWAARWQKIKRPERTSLYGYVPDTWWHEPD